MIKEQKPRPKSLAESFEELAGALSELRTELLKALGLYKLANWLNENDKNNKIFRMILAVIAALFLLVAVAVEKALPQTIDNAKVTRVYDGDTVYVEIPVRIIGIDTPELRPKECYGIEAKKKALELLGKKVKLHLDSSSITGRYNRLLVYIEQPDGKIFNEEMIKEGLARELTKYPMSPYFKDKYKMLEDIAKVNKKGLWKECEGYGI